MLIGESGAAQTVWKSAENNFICRGVWRKFRAFHFGNSAVQGWTPPPSRSIGIIELGEKRKVIYGAQWFAGKILRTKALDATRRNARLPLAPRKGCAFFG